MHYNNIFILNIVLNTTLLPLTRYTSFSFIAKDGDGKFWWVKSPVTTRGSIASDLAYMDGFFVRAGTGSISWSTTANQGTWSSKKYTGFSPVAIAYGHQHFVFVGERAEIGAMKESLILVASNNFSDWKIANHNFPGNDISSIRDVIWIPFNNED